MRRVLAVGLAVILMHLLLSGSSVDLGALLAPASAALLLLGVGLGLLARSRIPFLSDTLALALLVPLRGPLCDLVFALGPGGGVATASAAAMLSLAPVGFFLGRRVADLMHGGLSGLMLGVVLGEVLVALGAAGWLSAPIAGPLAAMALALLVDWTGDEHTTTEDDRPAVHGLFIGVVFGLLVPAFLRIVPGYVEPSSHAGADVVLAMLVPGLLVAWPASVLVGRGRAARGLGLVAGLLLAAAIVHTARSLGLYQNAMAHVALTREFRGYASVHAPYVTEWGAWLLSFAGLVAAGLGMACGALRARSAGWIVLGVAVGVGAQYWLLHDPVRGPFVLVLAAAGAAAIFAPLAVLPRAGWLALPLGVVPFLMIPLEERPGFDEMRRPGEFGVEVFQRSLAADATMFITPGPESNAVEGREAWRRTFTDRGPLFSLDENGALLSALVEDAHAHGAEEEGETLPPDRYYGVRLGGYGMHAAHAPLGEEGSLGRLTRLFAVPGRAFVTGVGAELLAADLNDAGLAEDISVSSPAPFGAQFTAILLDRLGSRGWRSVNVSDPVLGARAEAAESFATVLVAPTRDVWPGGQALTSCEHVARLARLLAPGGRCLLWLDTTDVSVRALRARIAAFAEVFGNNSAAFVEPRELDAPFVLLLGWRDEQGRPEAASLAARLPWPDETGLRVRLSKLDDLGSLLLRDGDGMVQAAQEWPVSSRARPVGGRIGSAGSWAAVRAAWQPGARLAGVIAGASDRPHDAEELMAGLALHTRYSYRLEGLNETLLEIKRDVDWALHDREVEHYVRAAERDSDDPLLHFVLAALLEPLANVGDFGRFAEVFEATGARSMSSWRLALLEAWVQQQSLEVEAAEAALQRARTLSDR